VVCSHPARACRPGRTLRRSLASHAAPCAAYEKLSAAQLIVASRATGTHVAERPRAVTRSEQPPDPGSFMEMYQEMTHGPAIFQMGVPAEETFPATLLARIRSHAVRVEARAAPIYPDPRGELELRREIAAYLAMARGIECSPPQVIITGGYSGGLGLALRVLGLEGQKVWMEDPGFPFTRRGLELARLSLAPIPVDASGIDVDYGLCHVADAKLVIVTPGQQAPLGVTLSLERRLRLLDWAAQEGEWVIEDDYLSELQLKGRAAPALASLDRGGRVIHIGSFSKTISPSLRLGFLVAPISLLSRFMEVAACLAPPPGPSLQLATAEFVREGHYLRHLRRSVPTPLSVTPRWSASSCTSKPPASRQRDWLRCCDYPTARQIYPSPRKPWRLEWHQPLCQPGTHGRLPDDRGFFWASRRYQTSISLDPATVSAGSSGASSESVVLDLGKVFCRNRHRFRSASTRRRPKHPNPRCSVGFSYGFRPGRGPHDALDALSTATLPS
jgi:DNA-binding transcriptional MocR family regulator